jgi:hypothetical protein
VRTPLVETEQHRSIGVTDLTPVVMSRSGFGPPKERLVPLEAACNVSDADDGPRSLHCFSHRVRNLGAYFTHGQAQLRWLEEVRLTCPGPIQLSAT